MAKVLNAVFGIGIAVVLYILVLLAIQAFYPEVRYEEFCNVSTMNMPELSGFEKCADNITVGECRTTILGGEKEQQQCSLDFDKANKAYNKNFFIIASILGSIIIIVAFFLMNIISISAGVACSGIVLVMWAFIRGWQSTNDKVKFVVGLIIAAIIITLAVLVNKRLAKEKEKKPSRKRK